MTTAIVPIEVDAETVRAFGEATDEQRRKLQLLLRLRLQELTAPSARPLAEIMDEIGREAQARGMTPDILESLLHGRAGAQKSSRIRGISELFQDFIPANKRVFYFSV